MTAVQDRVRAQVALRLVVGAVIGVVVGCVLGAVFGSISVGLVSGWIGFVIVFLTDVWVRVHGLDATRTARHATRDDPSVTVTHTITLLAAVASLASVALLLADASHRSALPASLLAVVSVAASWVLVHTVYTLRYAKHFYDDHAGGIDFNQTTGPTYADFAYFAFTVGMTYQVSDTTVTTASMRRIVLRQALLSYLLGAVVLASTINVLVQLA